VRAEDVRFSWVVESDVRGEGVSDNQIVVVSNSAGDASLTLSGDSWIIGICSWSDPGAGMMLSCTSPAYPHPGLSSHTLPTLLLHPPGEDETPVWDTGRRSHRGARFFKYGGSALAPGQHYTWRLRLWSDVDGKATEWVEGAFAVAPAFADTTRYIMAAEGGQDEGRSIRGIVHEGRYNLFDDIFCNMISHRHDGHRFRRCHPPHQHGCHQPRLVHDLTWCCIQSCNL
jgi:hypothetical protein